MSSSFLDLFRSVNTLFFSVACSEAYWGGGGNYPINNLDWCCRVESPKQYVNDRKMPSFLLPTLSHIMICHVQLRCHNNVQIVDTHVGPFTVPLTQRPRHPLKYTS